MMKLRSSVQGALILALLVLTGCHRASDSSSLFLGGDVLLYRAGKPLFPVEDEAISPWGDFIKVKQEEHADLFAVNLESPFGLRVVEHGLENPSMNLCADDDALQHLQQAGVNLITNHNNHVNDCGFSGQQYTDELLDQAGILHQRNHSSVQFVPAGGAVIAVLSINDYERDYEIVTVVNELKKARGASDLVLVSVHWGQEYQAGPSQHQQELAQLLVDAGADVIWGHHPHVLQRMEWLRSSADGHTGLVMYSLGNALSDQWMLPDAQRTALIRLTFSHHQVKDILVVPLKMDMSSRTLLLEKDPQLFNWYVERLSLESLEKKGTTIRLFEFAQTPKPSKKVFLHAP